MDRVNVGADEKTTEEPGAWRTLPWPTTLDLRLADWTTDRPESTLAHRAGYPRE